MNATLDTVVRAISMERVSWLHWTQLGLSLTALWEQSNGGLAGELGDPMTQMVCAGVEFQIEASLAGTLDENGGGIRLRLWRRENATTAPAVRARVTSRDGALSRPLLDWMLKAEAGGAAKEHQVNATDRLCGKVEQQVDAALTARMRLWALESYAHSSPEHPLVEATFDKDAGGRNRLAQTLTSGVLPDRESQVYLELHMPLLRWTDRRKLWGLLREAEVSATPDGALVVHTEETPPSTPVLAWAVMQHRKPAGADQLGGEDSPALEAGSSLRFSHTAKMQATQAQWLMQPLTDRYGLSVDWKQIGARKGSLEARLSLRLDGAATAAWLVPDREDTRRFLRQMRSTSRAAQLSLRNWIAFLYFCTPERLLDVEDNYAMLVYQSLRPYGGALLGQYSYDVLEPDPVLKALRAARKPLLRRLETMAPMLSGTRPKRARYFRSRRIQRAAECVRRLPRPLAALLTGEKSVIDDLCELALRGGEVRESIFESDQNPSGLGRHRDRVELNLRKRLRRMCMSTTVEDLTQMVVLEATAGLAAARGAECCIEALLELWHRDTGWEYAVSNSMRVFPSRPTR